MESFLEGLHQRVLLGWCADSILNRKNRNTEIEGWFAQSEVLDHLFYEVLLFIMEYSLSERGGCSLKEISEFLSKAVTRYGVTLAYENIERLASYMVKDILQNRGSVLYCPVFHHETGTFQQATVRLIEDRISEEKILLYRLSEQGYDFLLRTREIDSQFEGWVSMLITKQQLERRNYRESWRQARQSLQILRKQQTAFEEFIRSIRRDLRSVENDAYSRMISSFYENLETEQEMTAEIIKLLQEYRRELSNQKDRLLDQNDRNLEESLEYLRDMSQILDTIMDTENELLSHRYTVRKIYEAMLEASLTVSSSFRRYDMMETILKPSAGFHDEEMEAFLLLRRPLLIPRNEKLLNIGLLYAPQRILEEEDLESEVILQEEEEENTRLKEKQRRMDLYCRAFDLFLKYAMEHESFRVREFVTYCDRLAEENDTPFLSDDKSFYLMFLDLYSLGTIDFTALDYEAVREDESAEEFDLLQMFQRLEINPADLPIRSMELRREEGTDTYLLRTEQEDNLAYGMDCLSVTVRGKKEKNR